MKGQTFLVLLLSLTVIHAQWSYCPSPSALKIVQRNYPLTQSPSPFPTPASSRSSKVRTSSATTTSLATTSTALPTSPLVLLPLPSHQQLRSILLPASFLLHQSCCLQQFYHHPLHRENSLGVHTVEEDQFFVHRRGYLSGRGWLLPN